MLVLSRKRSEIVVITVGGVRVEVNVVELCGDRVKLGFSAPKDVAVNRLEVQRKLENLLGGGADAAVGFVR